MENHNLRVSKASICGQQYSQETLPVKLTNSFAGQSQGWQAISLILGFTFASSAGISSAFLVVYLVTSILISIFYPFEEIPISVLLSTLISISVLLGLVLNHNVKHKFQRLAITIISVSVVVGLFSSSSAPLKVLLIAIVYNLFVISVFSISIGLYIFSNAIILLVVKTKKYLDFSFLLNVILFSTIFFAGVKLFSEDDFLALGVNLPVQQIELVRRISILCLPVIILMAHQLSKDLRVIDERFSHLYDYALMIASWGGTSFYRLDLSHKDFTGSDLANTDLRAQKFYRTCFRGVTGLEKALVSNQYLDLDIPKVRQLLVNGFSEETDFSRVNLKGASLVNSDLRFKKFTGANLAGANLRSALLNGCCLAQADLTGADLSGATLTGACIDNWSINEETNLDGIVCDCVYRQVDIETGEFRGRCPISLNETLDSGDFEALIRSQTDTIDLIFQDGIDWQAFFQSFQQLCEYYRSESITIYAIERKRTGSSIIRLEASDISLEKRALIEQSAKNFYNENLRRLEAAVEDYRIRLQGQVHLNSELFTVVKTMAEKQGHTFNFSQGVGNVNASGVNIAGDQVGIQHNAIKQQALVDSYQEIQELWNIFESQYPSASENSFSQELAHRAEKDPSFRKKLSQWGERIANSSSEEAAKVVGTEFAKRVIPRALSLLIGLI